MPTKYIRPIFRGMAVGILPLCISPNSTSLPVKEFLVQAAISNIANIFIGDQNNTLGGGLEMQPGIAYQWSVYSDANLAGQQYSGSFDYAAMLKRAQRDAIGQGNNLENEIFYDLSDFYVISTAPGQNIKIYWSTRPI